MTSLFKKRGITLPEMMMTCVLGLIILFIVLAAMANAANSFLMGNTKIINDIELRKATSHLMKYVRGAAYTRVLDNDGNIRETGEVLRLFDVDDNMIGTYVRFSGQPFSFVNEDGVKTFENVDLLFSRVRGEANMITEVKASFTEPLSTTVYFSSKSVLKEDSWTKAFWRQSQDDCAYSVQRTSDGNYIIAGGVKRLGRSTAKPASFLYKCDADGNRIWAKTYDDYMLGIEGDTAMVVQETSEGGYIFAGWTSKKIDGKWGPTKRPKMYIVKTDNEGNPEWASIFITPEGDFKQWGIAHSVQETQDGGYIIGGLYGWTRWGTKTNAYVVKTDSDGGYEWSETYGEGVVEFVQEVLDDEGNADGYLIAKWEEIPGHAYNTTFYRTDASGNYAEGIDEETLELTRIFSVQKTADGYIAAGENSPVQFGWSPDFVLIKFSFSAEGDFVWEYIKTLAASAKSEIAYSVKQTSDGGYIVAGIRKETALDHDVYVVKTDSLGQEQWSRVFGRNKKKEHDRVFEAGYSVEEVLDEIGNPDGYMIVGAFFLDLPDISNDETAAYIIKTDRNGKCRKANTPDSTTAEPDEHFYMENYSVVSGESEK